MTYRAKDIRFTRWGEPSRRAAATGGAALVATLGEAALSPVVKGTKQTTQNPAYDYGAEKFLYGWDGRRPLAPPQVIW